MPDFRALAIILSLFFLIGTVQASVTSTFYLTEDSADWVVGHSETLDDFLTICNATGNYQIDNAASVSGIYISALSTAPKYSPIRGIGYGFNTSSLPDAVPPTSAVLSIWVASKDNTLGSTGLGVIDFEPPTQNNFTTTDYQKTQRVRLAADIDYANVSITGYTNFTLTNLSIINRTGYTNLYLQSQAFIDKSNATIPWASGAALYYKINDYTENVSRQPILTINYIVEPVSSFTVDYTGGYSPLLVNFTDTSVDPATQWLWYDDDTLFNTTQNPQFVPFTTGNHQIRLNAGNAAGWGGNSSVTWINVTDEPDPVPPVAEFSGTPLIGAFPLTVQFTDLSTSNILGRNWSFGDGSTSTDANPSHTYTTSGNYTVSLEVVNISGYNTTTKSSYIGSTLLPVASFTQSETSGVLPLSVTFTDTSTNSPASWIWDFGDGSTIPTSSAVNLVEHSEMFEDPVWEAQNVTLVTDNITQAPNGLMRGASMNVTGVNVSHYLWQNIPVTKDNWYTFSGYFKQYGINDIIQIKGGNGIFGTNKYLNLRLSNCSIVSNGTINTTVSVEDAGYGWCRASVTSIATATKSDNGFYVYFTGNEDRLGVPYFDGTGNTSHAVYLWGLQVEQNTTMGSYNATDEYNGNPTHIYTSAGAFTVNMTAFNAAGSDFATSTVTVVSSENGTVSLNASYDGNILSSQYGSGGTTWSSLRNGPGDFIYPSPASTLYGGYTASAGAGTYDSHYVAGITFNTASLGLPSNATITSATVSLFEQAHETGLGTVNESLIDFTPLNPVSYVATDYARTSKTRMASDILEPSFTGGWNTFNLTNLSTINKTGYTTFMLTHSAFVDNSSLTWANSASSGYLYKSAASSTKPRINITYSTGAPVATTTSFTANATYGTEYAAFQFTDTSSNSPTGWSWSFVNKTVPGWGGGNGTEVVFSTSQNPTYSFGTGNWTIYLNAITSTGYVKSAGTDIKVFTLAGKQMYPSDNIFYTNVSGIPTDPRSTGWINDGVNRGVGTDFTLRWSDDSASYNLIDNTLNITPRKVSKYVYSSDDIYYPIPTPVNMPPPPPANTDQNMFIINIDNMTNYWLYHAYPNATSGSYDTLSANYHTKSNTIRPYKGFAYSELDIKYEEVAAGSINHTIAANGRHTNKSSVWPWSGYYETYTNGTYPPLGQRFRLKSTVDISGMSTEAQVIAQALKTYGLVIDNMHGSEDAGFELYVVPDPRWHSDYYDAATVFKDIGDLHMSDFEAVNTTVFMISSSSMQSSATPSISGVAPTASFYMNVTGNSGANATYGAGTTYGGYAIGGSAYGGGTEYLTYTAATANYVATSKAALIANLSSATSGQVIFIPAGTTIDLTSNAALTIPAGVTLAGDRGHSGSAGATIRKYADASPGGWNDCMFEIGGANVRITGLTLEGEHVTEGNEASTGMAVSGIDKSSWGEAYLQTGIRNYGAYSGLTVDNCELEYWGNAAIISRGTGAVFNHNYIHHNEAAHDGYGVDVYGGTASIYANVFDYNRHSVTGSGAAGESYTAMYNVHLGHGVQTGGAHFDVHETGGSAYYIHHNTIYNGVGDTSGNGAVPIINVAGDTWQNPFVHITDNPDVGAYIYNNNILTDWGGTWQDSTNGLTVSNVYAQKSVIVQTYYGSTQNNVFPANNMWRGTVADNSSGILWYDGGHAGSGNTNYVGSSSVLPYADGAEPLNVTFTDTSTNTPTSWSWADTATAFSSSQNPTRTFYAGNHSINLTATNAYGSNISAIQWVNVSGTGSAPVANFTTANTTVYEGVVVEFTDTSTGGATSYEWAKCLDRSCTFVTDQTTQNATYTFSISRLAGVPLIDGYAWTVRHRAINAAGTSTKTMAILVAELPVGVPAANFTPRGTYNAEHDSWSMSIVNGSTVTFNETSSGGAATSYLWKIDHVNYSTSRNVTIPFNQTAFGASAHDITLYVTNDAGVSGAESEFFVTSSDTTPIPQFYATNMNTTVGILVYPGNSYPMSLHVNPNQTVQFTDASINSPNTWVWTIDAGNGSTYNYYTQNPQFTYTSTTTGYYAVTLVASNGGGAATVSQADVIYIADTLAPPAVSGITNSTNATAIQWNWTQDASVNITRIWKDGTIFENVTSAGTLWTGLTPNTTYQIATQTVDVYGNQNTTFVNSSATTSPTAWNFTTPGCTNWVAPLGETSITLKITGAGSSGQGGQSATYPGAGGNAGDHATYVGVPVIPGNTYPICIGTGGENSSYNDVAHAGTESSAFGYTLFGGAIPDFLTTGTTGGNGEAGAFSTAYFAFNGTNASGYTAGTAGIGYGAAGGGASHDAAPPYDTQGGRGADGYAQIILDGYSTTNTPEFIADSTSNVPGSLIHFTDLSTIIDTAGLTYNWSFGDGYYSSTAGNTQHVYSYTGTYDVSLALSTSNGTITETKAAYINIVSQNIQVTSIPRTVRLTCVDDDYNPVSGVSVSATPGGFTAPEDWLAQYYGVTGITFNGTTVSGLTGTDGSWAAPMMAAYLYNFTFSKANMTTQYMDFYPTSESYIISLVVIAEETPINKLITYSLYNATINSTAEMFNLTYKDTSGSSTLVTLIVKNTSGTVVYTSNTSVAGATEVAISSGAITHVAGDSYEYTLTAVRGDTNINQTRYVTWERLRTLSMFPDWVSQWFGIILLILLAGIFSAISVKFAVVIIPFFTGFLTIYMKMLDPLTGLATFLACLGIIAVIGALKYTREQERKL